MTVLLLMLFGVLPGRNSAPPLYRIKRSHSSGNNVSQLIQLHVSQQIKMSRPSLVFFGLMLVLVFAILVVEAEEREKRSPILGLLLAKKLLHGGGHHHHHYGGHHHHHRGYGYGGHGYGGHHGHFYG